VRGPDLDGLAARGAEVLGPLPGGARSVLWRVRLNGRNCVARRVVASEASLRWLDRLQGVAQRQAIGLARLIPAPNGALALGGWTLEPWLDGMQGQMSDLTALRSALRRMHRAAQGFPPRPGHASRLPIALPEGSAERVAVHGDVHPGNVLRLSHGGLALIDWEEARLGDPRLDLGFGSNAAGRFAHAAAEVAACWRAEPERARKMARLVRLLRQRGDGRTARR
jgi:Phosphotransferase enzyme family